MDSLLELYYYGVYQYSTGDKHESDQSDFHTLLNEASKKDCHFKELLIVVLENLCGSG